VGRVTSCYNVGQINRQRLGSSVGQSESRATANTTTSANLRGAAEEQRRSRDEASTAGPRLRTRGPLSFMNQLIPQRIPGAVSLRRCAVRTVVSCEDDAQPLPGGTAILKTAKRGCPSTRRTPMAAFSYTPASGKDCILWGRAAREGSCASFDCLLLGRSAGGVEFWDGAGRGETPGGSGPAAGG
jgi:hypothetical protein